MKMKQWHKEKNSWHFLNHIGFFSLQRRTMTNFGHFWMSISKMKKANPVLHQVWKRKRENSQSRKTKLKIKSAHPKDDCKWLDWPNVLVSARMTKQWRSEKSWAIICLFAFQWGLLSHIHFPKCCLHDSKACIIASNDFSIPFASEGGTWGGAVADVTVSGMVVCGVWPRWHEMLGSTPSSRALATIIGYVPFEIDNRDQEQVCTNTKSKQVPRNCHPEVRINLGMPKNGNGGGGVEKIKTTTDEPRQFDWYWYHQCTISSKFVWWHSFSKHLVRWLIDLWIADCVLLLHNIPTYHREILERRCVHAIFYPSSFHNDTKTSWHVPLTCTYQKSRSRRKETAAQ